MRYGFKTFLTKTEGHELWVVESTELQGCTAQGDTLDDALAKYETNEKEWIETAEKYGISLPEQKIQKICEYSGKLTLRMGKSMHRKLAEAAQNENISINALINQYIAQGIGRRIKV